MKTLFLCFVFGVLQIGFTQAGYYCTNYNYASNLHYCEDGCCDSWPYETCCTNNAWLGWAIAGGVIGGILLISLIVCVVCVFIKHKGKTGRVIQPNQGPGQVQPPAYRYTQAEHDKYCTNYKYDNKYHYCEHGCCDSWPYETCCTEYTWLGWAIAGGVIGGILLISLIVCVVCVVMKHKGKAGRIIQPNQSPGQVQPPAYTSTVSHVPTYPQNQGYYPQYTTTFTQNSKAPYAPPPAYQTLYEQHQQDPQRLSPITTGSQGQGNNQMT